MATKRRAAAAVVDETVDVKSPELEHPNGVLTPSPRKRRLEGFAWYVVYIPAIVVATFLAMLFTRAVEEYLYE